LSVGANIARIRRQKNWTQKELAKATRLSPDYVSAIERGAKVPSLKTLAILAERLGVDIKELIKGEA
jgi:transcriptional regulator with XRE-family HTH domain